MKNHCFLPVLLICFVAAFFFGCEDEKTQIGFRIDIPVAGQAVWNATPVSFQLPSDFTGSVDIRANGISIGQITSPNNTLNWNTRLFPDGAYTVEATATSEAGDRWNTSVDVVVKNTLLQVAVPQDHLEFYQKAFLFLSDAKGEIIAQQEIRNGDKIELPGPEKFDGATFMLNEAYLASPGYAQIFSVREVPRGQWTLNQQEQEPEFIGSVNLKPETIPSSVYYVSASGDSDFLSEENNGIVLATTQASTQIFLRDIGKAANKYALVKDIPVGSSLIFPLEKIEKPLQKQIVSLIKPYQEGGRIRLYGFTEKGNYGEYYPLGVFFRYQQQVTLEFPAHEFAAIGSENYYRTEQIRLYSFHPEKMHDINPINAQVEVSTPDNKMVDLATFGQFDVYTAAWIFFDEATEAAASWVMIGASSKSERLVLPKVPNEIQNLVPQIEFGELTFGGSIQVSDYETSTYAEYLRLVSQKGIAGPYEFGKAWKEQIFAGTGFTGGRTRSSLPMLVEILKVVE